MLGIHDYWLFIVLGILLILTPGQDTFYIVGRSLAHGVCIGVASALGISAGCIIHNFAAALGLSAIIMASSSAFLLIKYMGAAYLIYLGWRILTTPIHSKNISEIPAIQSVYSAFIQGLLTNLLNPKVALFFLALIPQFIDPSSTTKVAAFLVLGCTFLVMGTVWCIILALAAANFRGFFMDQPRITNYFSRAAGILFIGLGLRLSVSKQ